MKRKQFLIVGLVACGLALSTGCQIVRQLAGSPDALKADVTDAVRIGTRITLQSKPFTREKFTLAYKSLGTLLADGGNISGGKLVEIIQGLPINQFDGPNGSLYLEAGALVFNRIARGRIDIDDAPYVKAAAEGAYLGLGQALEQ